jgi:hypothetical protein
MGGAVRTALKVLSIAMLVASSTAFRQSVPQNWKLVMEPTKTCRYAIPGDWSQDTTHPNASRSVDNKMAVVGLASDPGQSLDETKRNARREMPPARVFEDSERRYWYVYRDPADGEDSPDTHWYVAVQQKGHVCSAQITFRSSNGIGGIFIFKV